MKIRSFWKVFLAVVLLYFGLQIRLIGESSVFSRHNLFLFNGDQCGSQEFKNSYVFPDSEPRDLHELHNRKVPNVFHFVICDQNTNHSFLFNDYLSVLSAWRNFEPDQIEIHYKGEIIQDKYNSWLDDLKSMIPGLVTKKIPDYWINNDECDISYGQAILQDRGGVYISKNAILTKHALANMKSEFNVLVDPLDNIKFIFSERKHENLTYLKIKKQVADIPITGVSNETSFERYKRTNFCAVENTFDSAVSKCVIIQKQYFPKDFFEPNSNFEEYISTLYRLDSGVNEKSNLGCKKQNSVPKVVHYVWFHPITMTYMMYLSLVSALYILKPEAVYIHGDLQLYGDYWDNLKHDPRIILVYRENPSFIFGHMVKYTTHGSDVVRADILLKYGGIYQDWDALWVNPVDKLLSSGNEVMLNYDHMVATKAFPDQLNMGVAIAAPRSKFFKAWQAALINFRTDDFYYNALELPYKILERFPETVKIEQNLQVMCFRLKCHPIYHKNHRDWTKHQDFDWREVYSLHFTFPDPPEYQSEETLYNSTGLFAEIGRHIVDKKANG